MQYFGSNIVEGVAESWVEAEMSWVEVDGAGWSWVHGLVIPINYSHCKNFIVKLDHVPYSWYVALFFNSDLYLFIYLFIYLFFIYSWQTNIIQCIQLK